MCIRDSPKILAAKLNWTNQETEEQLEVLVKGKKAVRLSDGSFIHKDYWNEITQYGTELLNQFHKENPISDGMEKEEFKSRILPVFLSMHPSDSAPDDTVLLRKSDINLLLSAVVWFPGATEA